MISIPLSTAPKPWGISPSGWAAMAMRAPLLNGQTPSKAHVAATMNATMARTLTIANQYSNAPKLLTLIRLVIVSPSTMAAANAQEAMPGAH